MNLLESSGGRRRENRPLVQGVGTKPLFLIGLQRSITIRYSISNTRALSGEMRVSDLRPGNERVNPREEYHRRVCPASTAVRELDNGAANITSLPWNAHPAASVPTNGGPWTVPPSRLVALSIQLARCWCPLGAVGAIDRHLLHRLRKPEDPGRLRKIGRTVVKFFSPLRPVL